MKNIAIITNLSRDPQFKHTNCICDLLKKYAKIFLMDECRGKIESDADITYGYIWDKTDMIITLGGDGTILHIAPDAAEKNIPVLAINLGHLGFLTQIEEENIEEGIKKLIDGDYDIYSRSMVKADVIRDDKCIHTFHALNDIVIARASLSRLLNLKLSINGDEIDTFHSDGMIISTPTGSTAYALSAGGPVLDPTLDATLVLPICPHSMRTRPMVLPSKHNICIEFAGDDIGDSAFVSADGKRGINLLHTDKIVITKSEHNVKMIKIKSDTFFDTLRKKFREDR